MGIITQILLGSSVEKNRTDKKRRMTYKMKNLSEQKIINIVNHIEDLCYNQCYMKNSDDKIPGNPFLTRNIPATNPVVITKTNIDLIYNLSLSLLRKIYGADNEHVNNFQSQLFNFNNNESIMDFKEILNICLAKLEFIKIEIKLGLVSSIENEVTGEVMVDFLSFARKSLIEDILPVAAVLGCASLEDTLKRFAKLNSIEVEDKTMSEVVNALKSKGYLSSAQSSILKGYTQIRNKAFHTEWDKIEKSDISSIIGFTEEFILKHFTG